MKKSFILIIALFFFYIGFAQNGLLLQSNSKGLYLSHTVAPKENFYSIGRLYNISPKDIAAFNGLDMNNGLSVGQPVMVPLNANNFIQSKNTGTPVYYVVGEKEGLYRVSVNSGKATMANLRKWNNLSNDNISTGQRLIVGYLQSTEMQNNPVAIRTEPAASPAAKEVQKQQPETVVTQTQKAAEPPKSQAVTENKTAATPAANKPLPGGGSGYFKNQFEAQSRSAGAGKDVTVTSGIFKTSSGWQDAKYYALIDKVEPGTIVQIINPTNNKAIYAKVLGEMSGIRQNQGLELRISNAAASALEINDTEKFIVRVAY
jgi:LysM repeat protein